MEDELIFADESDDFSESAQEPWKLLIVDDDEEVHKVTKLALNDFTFADRNLQLISAYSAEQARTMLGQYDDIAVILLDVVMETDDAGLNLVKVIREEIKNSAVRIILRTGQPGQAPEKVVIRDYDINDYKAKTELTSQKLYTLVLSSLRSYRDIVALDKNRRGLEKVIRASRGIFEKNALDSFIEGTLEQLLSLINADDSMLVSFESYVFQLKNDAVHRPATGEIEFEMLLKHGRYNSIETRKLAEFPDALQQLFRQALDQKTNIYTADSLIIFCEDHTNTTLFHVSGTHNLSELDKNLLNIFTENIIVALENIRLNDLIRTNQKEMIYRLSEVVETRSQETGNHVKRVAKYGELFGKLLGMPEDETEILKLAAPLHDIGKVGIPDAILHKPGKLDDQEWEIMKTHAQIGHDMLADTEHLLLNAGAIIALTHHEKWNGSGYPLGAVGEKIHIFGRIIAMADVFDALGSKRCYKEPWPLDKILDLIKDERGKSFDPQLVDLFLDNLDDFLAIRDTYKD